MPESLAQLRLANNISIGIHYIHIVDGHEAQQGIPIGNVIV